MVEACHGLDDSEALDGICSRKFYLGEISDPVLHLESRPLNLLIPEAEEGEEDGDS